MIYKKIAFNPNSVVWGNDFFGRENEIDSLSKRLFHDQSVLITGERRIGKTSLLLHAKKSLKIFNEDVPIIWLESHGSSNLPNLIEKIQYSLKQIGVISTNITFNELRLFNFLKKLSLSHGKVIFFISDLDDMLGYISDDEKASFEIASFFRSIIDSGHVVACATSFKENFPVDETLIRAPLSNVFYVIVLKGFTESEAINFLMEVSSRSGNRLNENECRFAISLIGLIPYNLQQFGFDLFSHETFSDSTDSDRKGYLISAIERCSFSLEQQWNRGLSSLSPSKRSTLFKAASSGKIKENQDTTYLLRRGYIDIKDNPFQSMGRLYKQYLIEAKSAFSDDGQNWEGVRNFAQSITSTITKTIIESAMKTYLQ